MKLGIKTFFQVPSEYIYENVIFSEFLHFFLPFHKLFTPLVLLYFLNLQ